MRWIGIPLLVLAAAYVAYTLARPLPVVRVSLVAPRPVVLAGTAPAWPWPAQGEAALAVAGVGVAGTHGGDAPVPIASVAKVMTAWVLLHDHPLPVGADGPSLTMTAADAAAAAADARTGQSVLPVHAGEKLTERQALQALLVASANNIADAIARFDAGSLAAFTQRMNDAASSLGMHHTHYTDPSGLTASTVSTAADQLVLAKAALGMPSLAATAAMPQVSLPGHDVPIPNYDSLVGHGGFVGLKTGSSEAAGGCLVFAARRSIAGATRLVYGVVLGQQPTRTGVGLIEMAEAGAQRLVAAASHDVTRTTVLPAGTRVGRIQAPGNPTTALATTAPASAVGWPGLALEFAPVRTGPPSPTRPNVAGRLSDPEQTVSVPVAPVRPLQATGWQWRLRHPF